VRIATAILFLSGFGGAASAQSDRLTLSTFADQISRDSLDQLPGALEASKVLDKISVLPEAEVADALPRFTGLLNGQPIEKKRIAMVALMCVARRGDAAKLLSPIVDTLLHEVDDEEDFVSTQTTLLLAGLYRDPPATLVNNFVVRLGQQAPDSPRGPVIAYGLMKMAPDSPAAQDAVVTFLTRAARNPKMSIDALRAVASPRVTNEKLIAAIVQLTIESVDPSVKVAGIVTLQKIGPKAIAQASPQLSAMANNKAETDAVRSAAQDALHLQSAQ